MDSTIDSTGLYAGPQSKTALVGGPGSGKTQALVECVAQAIQGGENPDDVLVLAASPTAAAALRERLERAGVAGVVPTTPMALAQEGLAGAEVPRAHRLASFEETFFLEDMRVTGMAPRRLREMLKFLERGWSEMRDDEPGWLVTKEEEGLNGFARTCLASMGALHPTEVAAAYVRLLAERPEALATARKPLVFADDYQAMSRASQRLACMLAARELTVAWSPVAGLKGEEFYDYRDGLAELGATQVVALDWSCLAAAPAQAVENLCRQECLAAVDAPACTPDAPVGTFEVVSAADLSEELDAVVSAVRGLLDEGFACNELYLAQPNDAWVRRVTAALVCAGIPASGVQERQALGGDVRDAHKSTAPLAYTALHLAADPQSATAWRCWCGFGDYLTCSSGMTRLAQLGADTGRTLPELLAALEAGELDVALIDRDAILGRYRAGRALLEAAEGLKGSELLAVLAKGTTGSAEVPSALAALVGEAGADEDAPTLYARAQKALLEPVFSPGAVRVGGFDAALGQNPRALVCCGMVNGLVPPMGYFELTQTTIDAQNKMHERLVERLAALAGKAREALVCVTFKRATLVEAETLKLKTERVRLRDGQRLCDLGSSVCIDYLTGAKLAYVR